MLRVSLRDLQWRRRRFLVGLVATGLVFAVALVLTGLSAAFGNEARRSVDAFRASAWVVPRGVAGPFMSSVPLPASDAATIAALPGVDDAAPVAILRGDLRHGRIIDTNVIGVPVGSFAVPPIHDGRAPARDGEITVDTTVGVPVGAHVRLGDRPFVVVGRTAGLSYRAGVGAVYTTLREAQAIGYAGAPLASAIVTRGVPRVTPANVDVRTNDEVRTSLLAPLENPRKTIALVEVLLWVLAAMITGSAVYLSSLDRTRDFAVFKAVGVATRELFTGLVFQALLICGGAYVLALVFARVLEPTFPMNVEVPRGSYGLLLAVAAVVALVASAGGIRRVSRVDPALAFGGMG